MRYRHVIGLMLIAALCSFSSCYEIVEEITYTDDIKGHFAYTANLSQSKAKIKTLLLLDTFMGARVPDIPTVKNHVAQLRTLLKGSEGISDVKISEDYENFIFKVDCNFSTTENLNKALKNIAEVMAQAQEGDFVFPLAKTANSFSRKTELKQELVVKRDNVVKMMNAASYTCIYRFAKEVQSVSNKGARISKDRKAVFLKTDIPSLITNPKTLDNDIILK